MLESNIPLLRHNTWRVQSRADNYYCPQSISELSNFLKQNELPVTWLGLGSNVLLPDNGISGIVIHTHKGLDKIYIDKSKVIVEAGVPCAKIARLATKNHFPDAAFFAGIPGTMGGALFMNAGAFGGETWDYVKSVTTINEKGILRIRTKEDYQIGYRSVKGPNEWFISAELQFQENKTINGMQMIKDLLKKRSLLQPIGMFSCGSVFKNPENHKAAQLIDACGLKGYRIGGAHVSKKHANFIINDKNATSKEIQSLVDHIINTVRKNYNIQLETEFRMLGGV